MKLFFDFFLVAGMLISVLILVLLTKSKHKDLSQKLLIIFFSFIFFFILNAYSDFHDLEIVYILTFVFNDFIEIFIGPLLFVYIKSLFLDHKTIFKNNWIHFVPSIIFILVASIPFLISILNDAFLFDYLKILNTNQELIFFVIMLYLILYLILSLRLFYRYRKAMKSNFSSIAETNFRWVEKMLIGVLIVVSIDECFSLYEIFVEELNWTDVITLFLIVILITYLGYYGVKQTKVLLPDFLIYDSSSNEEKKVSVDLLANIKKKELDDLKKRVYLSLQEDKLYLDEDLTLGKLAAEIAITDKKLSTLLNNHMNTTFYDIVNAYRVKAVKEKIASQDYDGYTLLGIAYECGFKSKTSFNRVFKKETDLSPSEFKKTLKNS